MSSFEKYAAELHSGKLERSEDSLKKPEPFVAPEPPPEINAHELDLRKIGKYIFLILIVVFSLIYIFRKKPIGTPKDAPISSVEEQKIDYIQIESKESRPRVRSGNNWKLAQKLALARIKSNESIVRDAIAQFYASGKPGTLCILFDGAKESACKTKTKPLPLKDSRKIRKP